MSGGYMKVLYLENCMLTWVMDNGDWPTALLRDR